MTAATHDCPGPGPHAPTDQVAPDKLACPACWRRVSRPTQIAVYRTWSNGLGAGSAAHRAAMLQAIREMQR